MRETMIKKIERVFVDMDGVLADFITGIESADFLDKPLVTEQDYDNNKVSFINKRLFRNLPPMEGMLDLIDFIKQHNLPWEILSAAGLTENRNLAVYDKTAWIREHVCPYVAVTCTANGKKKAIFAKPNRVLIDDRLDNIEAWEKAGGIGILHKSVAETIETLTSLIRSD